jgi:hypothetical protein
MSWVLRARIDSGLAKEAETGTSLSMSSTVSLQLAGLLSIVSKFVRSDDALCDISAMRLSTR